MATHVSGTEFDNGAIIPVHDIVHNEHRELYQLGWHHSTESLSVFDNTLPWGMGQTRLKFFGGVTADYSNIVITLIRDERYDGDDPNEITGVYHDFEYWLTPGVIAVITNVSEGYGQVSLTISRTGNDFGATRENT